MSLRPMLFRIVPWLITAFALVIAFRDIAWEQFFSHLQGLQIGYALLAVALTILSYLMRARRWQYLVPSWCLNYSSALRVLILGFFMNNVLPARTGELVRAHLGSKVSGQTRTTVLASVASERLLDGMTLSFLFAVFARHLGDAHLSSGLRYVALAFLVAGVIVLMLVATRARLLDWSTGLLNRSSSKSLHYISNKLNAFIGGLAPLARPSGLPLLSLWSLAVWGIELGVYFSVGYAFQVPLATPAAVLFLVAVNFASLVPAAPGGIGVVEAVGSLALISVGIERELALPMVVLQHGIQYLVVGIPGALLLLTQRGSIHEITRERESADVKSTSLS